MPDIAELIAELLGPQDDLGVTDVVITRETPGVVTPGSLADGVNATETQHTARGFIEGAGVFMDKTKVREQHVKISIFGASISPALPGDGRPRAGDRVTIKGATYKVARVPFDSVNAVYECEAKG